MVWKNKGKMYTTVLQEVDGKPKPANKHLKIQQRNLLGKRYNI